MARELGRHRATPPRGMSGSSGPGRNGYTAACQCAYTAWANLNGACPQRHSICAADRLAGAQYLYPSRSRYKSGLMSK